MSTKFYKYLILLPVVLLCAAFRPLPPPDQGRLAQTSQAENSLARTPLSPAALGRIEEQRLDLLIADANAQSLDLLNLAGATFDPTTTTDEFMTQYDAFMEDIRQGEAQRRDILRDRAERFGCEAVEFENDTPVQSSSTDASQRYVLVTSGLVGFDNAQGRRVYSDGFYSATTQSFLFAGYSPEYAIEIDGQPVPEIGYRFTHMYDFEWEGTGEPFTFRIPGAVSGENDTPFMIFVVMCRVGAMPVSNMQ